MMTRRWWGWPLVPVYGAALRLKEMLRREPKKLGWPVISVGSLSAGGAGKTPVVLAVLELLRERGWYVDVLTRGYGREGRGIERVDGDDARRFGDEPVLLAQRSPLNVWVGGDRYAAGIRAEAAFVQAHSSGPIPPDEWGIRIHEKRVHLLDDGFQHRKLARTVDLVLVTAEDAHDVLLPAGNLREPLETLRRADIVILREEDVEKRAAVSETRRRNKDDAVSLDLRLRPLLRENTLIWMVRRSLRFPGRHSSAACESLNVFGAGLRPIAFCAIARPEGFAKMLIEAGCGIVETVFFPDHHAYDLSDMAHLVRIADKLKATGFVTTEKDVVKLTPAMRERLEQLGPVMVAELTAEFVYPERVARELESRLGYVAPEEPA